MAKSLTVRFRVDFGSRCSVGVGKIELWKALVAPARYHKPHAKCG